MAAAARHGHRLVWLAGVTVVAAMAASTLHVMVAAVALALAVALHDVRLPAAWRPVIAAGAAAVAVPVLLRQGRWGFQGASALVTAVAVGPVLWPSVAAVARPVADRVATWDRRSRRVATGIVALPVILLLATVALAYWASSEMRHSLSAARAGDTAGGSGHLHDARTGFTAAHWLASGPLAPLRMVPVLSQHVRLLGVSTGEAAAVSRTGDDVLAIGRYDDLKTGDGRINLERMRALVKPVGRAETRLGRARRHIADASSPWLLGPAKAQLAGFTDEIARAAKEADLVGELARTLPAMLGGDGERVYFVAFLNPAEQRGGGGFLGSYAELRANDGRLKMTRSGSIIDLIDAVPQGRRTLDGPADYLRRYGVFHPEDFLQDVPFSPHFPFTAEVLSQLYPQSGGTHLDGILAVDPYALAAMLTFTGPIKVDGFDQPLTAQNAAEVLVRDQYVLFDANVQSDQDRRRDTLDELAESTFRRLTEGSLPGPRQLQETLGPMVRQRRLQMHADRPAEQRLLDRVGLDGAMHATGVGDYLMVSHQNLGNSKIDAYLQRSTTYRAVVDPLTGQERATVTVRLRNTAPASGLPNYVLGNRRGEPIGSNVMQLSVYSHLGFVGGTDGGAPLAVLPGQEAGASVVTARVVVPPRQTRTVVFRLAGGVALPQGRYRLQVVPQPSVVPDTLRVDVRVGGETGGGQALVQRDAHRLTEPELLTAELGGH